ncbi:MAG TPA: alpha-L-arabinofuranosidase, partial [Micromonosporaceae bacterium]|nr:alpha-L-arabinofuranosidase [Micromonosporaceae bacterium]
MRIRLRPALAVCSAVALTIAASIALTANASAAITSSQLKNPLSGRCLDVASAGTANGTQIQLWDCNGTNAQLWTSTTANELKVTIG